MFLRLFQSKAAPILAGPRSIYEFELGSNKIYLMGERHYSLEKEGKLTQAQKMEYRDFFNSFFTENLSDKIITIHLEFNLTYQPTNNWEDYSFMDCIAEVGEKPNISIRHSDNRKWGNNHSFEYLFIMLGYVNNLLSYVKQNALNNLKIHFISDKKSFVNDLANEILCRDEILEQIRNRHSDPGKQMTIREFITFYKDELKQLEGLFERFNGEIESETTAMFMAANYTKLNDALEKAIKLFSSIGPLDPILDESVINALLRIAKVRQSSEPFNALFSCILPYALISFDRELVCIVQNFIASKPTDAALVIVTGDNHTQNLAEFLQILNVPCRSLIKNDKSDSINCTEFRSFLHKSSGLTPQPQPIKRNSMCSIS